MRRCAQTPHVPWVRQAGCLTPRLGVGAVVSTFIRRSLENEPIYAELVVDELDGGTALALRSGMEYAAKATLNEADAQPRGDSTFSAFLRLRQGASARASWVLEETPGGTMVSVGADLACDWQLRAAFVPARAFSILVVGGRTFMRSGPEPGVLLNGKPLDEGWVQVPDGARIDVGLARIEVTMGYSEWAPSIDQAFDLRSPFNPPSARAPESAPQAHADDAFVRQAVHELHNRKQPQPSLRSTQAYDGFTGEPRAHAPAPRPVGAAPRKRNSTIELSLDDLDYMGTQAVAQARHEGDISGEYAVGGADPELIAPSLLGGERPKDKSKLWRYAVLGVFTAGAYGGWVYLLDYL